MKELVFIRGNIPFTNSLVIADGTENQHESVIRLIRKHLDKFERWGKIQFSDLKSGNPLGGRPTVIAELNEQQATFLVTLLRNNDIVLEFKSELVDQFYKMRELLEKRKTAEWQEARNASRMGWRPLTDVIKQLAELAHEQGSTTDEKFFYMTYAKLMNKMLHIKAGSRDKLEAWQNYELEKFEFMLKCILADKVPTKENYKKIYHSAKQTLENYCELSFINQRFIAENHA